MRCGSHACRPHLQVAHAAARRSSAQPERVRGRAVAGAADLSKLLGRGPEMDELAKIKYLMEAMPPLEPHAGSVPAHRSSPSHVIILRACCCRELGCGAISAHRSSRDFLSRPPPARGQTQTSHCPKTGARSLQQTLCQSATRCTWQQ